MRGHDDISMEMETFVLNTMLQSGNENIAVGWRGEDGTPSDDCGGNEIQIHFGNDFPGRHEVKTGIQCIRDRDSRTAE